MEIKQFTELFAEQFEETSPETFNADTRFRDVDEWDSLIALSIIAMIDEEFDIQISGDEMKSTNTIQELFDLVKQKK